MVFVMDESTKITIANKQAHDHLGYKPKQLIGKTITDLFPRSEVPQAIQRHQELIEKGKPSFTYSSLLTAKGEKIRVDLAGSAARNANGKLIGTMIVAREIDSEALLRALNGI